ncbi:hypothetical protein [Corynebacterium neomassiliense]|uniref:hypothetical protein n=1 Tax=Corynebacterium neomassiliense TaxID=2079482 RepID=UPI00192A188C|nr:hypothetical protein [Corynebacterium neomassiliense]
MSGFPYGYVLVAVLLIFLARTGARRDDPDSANLSLMSAGFIVLVLSIVTVFIKNAIIGASPEDLKIPGESAMDFSLASGFWIVIALAIVMMITGFIGLGVEDTPDSAAPTASVTPGHTDGTGGTGGTGADAGSSDAGPSAHITGPSKNPFI